MRPSGYTNITMGVAWGLATLSSDEPFSEAAPFGTRNLTKYMVVLTDGDNTRNRFTSDAREIDERTRLACRVAKDTGVKLFTICVVEGNRRLLRECASTTDMYHEVRDASEILPAFRRILNEIKAIRLTS
jgi:hypothetical protein